jgi:hypothetical protein
MVRADIVPAANGLVAALREGTPAVLDVATFPVGGKNRTALPSAQGLPGRHRYRFPLIRRHRMRNGADKPVTELWLSLPPGHGRWTGRRLASASAAACCSLEIAWHLPAGLAVIGRRRCVAQLLPPDTDMT